MAGVEFRALVRSRSFLIGLVMPPLFGAIGGLASMATRPEPPRPAPVRVAVADRSDSLLGALELAAARRNEGVGAQEGVRLELERLASAPDGDDGGAALDRRLAAGELQGWLEIPADAGAAVDAPVQLRLVTRGGIPREIPSWLESAVREELRTQALRAPGVSAALRARLERPVRVELEAPRPAPGAARAVAPDPRAAPARVRFLLAQLGPYQKLAVTGPLALILLLSVSLSSAPLFQAVLEEKTSRVSEILVSSISPFELMLGKLLGSLAACGIAAFAYAGTLLALFVFALGAALPLGLLALFAVYLVLALLLWGALYLSVGAACADVKDAQNLMLPLVLLQVLPLLLLTNVAAAPSGRLAQALSLFPPSAPMAMLLRLGYDPAPPVLEIAASLALLAVAALACTWAAGRVLRVGLLAHGRAASLREIARWVRQG